MDPYILAQLNSAVTPRQVAERYGFSPNQAGFICCPAHGEKTGSLKLYEDHWHCYGCHKGGKSVDLVEEILHCDFLTACKALNDDFGLGIMDGPESEEARQKAAKALRNAKEKKRKAEAEKNRAYGTLRWCKRHIGEARAAKSWNDITPEMVKAFRHIDGVLEKIEEMNRPAP